MNSLHLDGVLFEEFEESADNYQESHNYAYPYNTDYNHLYCESERSKVAQALNLMGFLEMDQLFCDEKIDFDVFTQLDQYGIFQILNKYPIGIRYKFLKRYNEWQSETCKQNHLLAASSSKSLSFTSSSNSISQSIVDDNTFSNIMNGTEEGRKFMLEHPCDKVLVDHERRELCRLICGHLLNENISLGKKEIAIIAKSIPNVYSKEKAECYFESGKGFLYYKSVNMKSRFRDHGMILPPPNKKYKVQEDATKANYSREECVSDEYIKNHPFESNDQFNFHWKQSANRRIAEIQMDNTESSAGILETYKTFRRSDGYYYVLLDFDHLYPNVSFTENWDNLRDNLIKVFARNITNARIKDKFAGFNKMKSSSKVLTTLLALHGQLYSRGSIKSEAKDKVSRDTIEDGYSQMISIIKSEGLVTMHLADVKEKAKARKQSIQPFIVCFGNDIEDISDEILLIFDDVKYKFSDINKALEVLLKLFTVFNLKYPPTCKNVYEFLSLTLLNQNLKLGSKGQSLLNIIENVDHI